MPLIQIALLSWSSSTISIIRMDAIAVPLLAGRTLKLLGFPSINSKRFRIRPALPSPHSSRFSTVKRQFSHDFADAEKVSSAAASPWGSNTGSPVHQPLPDWGLPLQQNIFHLISNLFFRSYVVKGQDMNIFPVMHWAIFKIFKAKEMKSHRQWDSHPDFPQEQTWRKLKVCKDW